MNIMLNITLHAFVALSPLVAAVSALADTVTLRPSVRVAHGSAVTLADLASLDGDALVKFSTLEIARADSGAFEISAENLRQKLAAAGAELRAIRIRGDTTVVRPIRGRVAELNAAPTRPTVENPAVIAVAAPIALPAKVIENLVDPSAYADQATPLGVACNLVSNAFPDESKTMRLFIREHDLAKLAPKPGLRYEIDAKTALGSDCVHIEVVAFDDTRIVSRERIRVEPRLLREVCVIRCDGRRGASLDAQSITTERRLLAPRAAERVAAPGEAIGEVLARTVPEGALLERDDLAHELAIHRNDRVMVRREVGMVAIEIEAIALEDGSAGDVIALERTDKGRSRDAQPLSAEVVGRGRAVIR